MKQMDSNQAALPSTPTSAKAQIEPLALSELGVCFGGISLVGHDQARDRLWPSPCENAPTRKASRILWRCLAMMLFYVCSSCNSRGDGNVGRRFPEVVERASIAAAGAVGRTRGGGRGTDGGCVGARPG